MFTDEEQCERLESKLKSNEEFEEEVKQMKILDSEVIDYLDSFCISEDTIREKGINGRAQHQFTWRQRACIVMHYLHPRLGNRDPSVVSDVCKVPARTVQNWISCKSMIPKWLSFAKSLTTQDTLSSIPSKHEDAHVDRCRKRLGTPFEMSMKSVKLDHYEERASKGKKHVACDSKDNGSDRRRFADKTCMSAIEKR